MPRREIVSYKKSRSDIEYCLEVILLILRECLEAGLWIRIGSGFSGFLDPDSESGSGTSGRKPRN
jgi:hypothetical protein